MKRFCGVVVATLLMASSSVFAAQLTGKVDSLDLPLSMNVGGMQFVPASDLDTSGISVGDVVTVIYSPNGPDGNAEVEFIHKH